MKKNLFELDVREKNRIRSLHESYINHHGTFLLKEASTEEITSFQEIWNERNPDDKIKVDGMYGPETKSRVTKFQKAAKLKVDGIIGPETLSAVSKADESIWDKIKNWLRGDDGKEEDADAADAGDVKSDEEIDPDEEGMCPNATNDVAYRMIKKALSGWGTDEKMLWKALGMLKSWDEYKNMTTVIKCETQDKVKSISAYIMSDLGGRDLEKFKAIRRAIRQDGSWGEAIPEMWGAARKRQAEMLGEYIVDKTDETAYKFQTSRTKQKESTITYKKL